MMPIFENENGQVYKGKETYEFRFQAVSCVFPSDWFSNQHTNLNGPEFYALLLKELCLPREIHVSACFYRALKKYCYKQEFQCLVEEI